MTGPLSAAAGAARDLRRFIDSRTRQQFRVSRHALRMRRSAVAWSDEQKRAWMLQSLRAQASFATAHFHFWRARFANAGLHHPATITFHDLAQLPPLERDELPELFAEAQQLDTAGAGRVVRTGGSSGAPAELLKGPEELGWSESATQHFRTLLGIPLQPSTAFVWGHHLDPVTRASRREKLEDWLFEQRWFDIFRIDDETLTGYDRELQQFRPELIVAYAAALDALAAAINPHGTVRRAYPTKAIITGAEKLLPHHRARIEATFGAPVYEQYGGRDVGLIAHQLNARSAALTVDWAQMLVEPELVATESPLLVTKLHADAMPVFRYRVGDYARFPAHSEPGVPALQLEEVVGRELNMLWRADGARISGMLFPHLLKDFPLREFQVRQDETLAVTVLVVPREGYNETHEREIRDIISANLQGCPVVLERVAQVPRGANRKLHPVIAPASIRPLASSLGRPT